MHWRKLKAEFWMAAANAPELVEIPGYPCYRASSDGRIWTNIGRPSCAFRPMKSLPDRAGYPKITFIVDGRRIQRFVHTQVAAAFFGSKPRGADVRHLNGVKADNRVENLCYGTRTENEHDKVLHGKKPLGEKVGGSKLKSDQVREIRRRLRDGETQRSIARELGLDPSTISDIHTGQSWSHLWTGAGA